MAEEEEDQVYTVQYIDASEPPTTWIARAGRAKVTYVNGDIYEGTYNEGKQRHGNGTYTWHSLTPEPEEPEEDEPPPPPAPLVVYSGDYLYGQKHGLGAMTYPDGSSYRGQWAYNQRHGRGTYFYNSGDKYSGEWKEGKRHGNGVFVLTKTESQLVGTFVNGQMVSGKWLLLDGTVYTGNFKNSSPEGNGSFTLPNGNTVAGKYVTKGEEEDEEEEEEEGKGPEWIAAGPPTKSITSHAELSRPPMPALPYVPAWDQPMGNVGLRITEVDVEGGWAVIQHVKAETGEEEEAEPEEDEEEAPKDTSANLKGMTLTIESAPGVASKTIVFTDLSLQVGAKLRLLSGAAANVPPVKPPPKAGEEEDGDEPEEEEDEEDAVPRKEYFAGTDNMFAAGFASISLSFIDIQGATQLVWRVSPNAETGALEHEGTYKPVPPPEPEVKEGEEEEEEEDEDDE